MLKRMILMLIVVALVFGGIFGFKFMFSAQQFANFTPPPRVVSADYAKEEIWQPYLSSIGTLSAVNGVDLSSEVDGKVKVIHFQSGLQVKAGDLLLEIDDEVEQANLKSLEARLKLARLNYRRDEKLIEKKLTSQEQIDRSRAELDEVVALVEQTRATIAKKKIRAPFSGKIGIRQVDLGQFISAGEMLTNLQAVNNLYIDFNLPEQDFTRIYMDQRLVFSVDAYPDQEFVAQVIAINAKVDPNTRNILVRARFDNTDQRLVPGMFASVKLILDQSNSVVTLPQTAVSYSLYGETVFVVQRQGSEMIAQRRSVVTGMTQNDRVAIMSGVNRGDLVVTDGQVKLKNGTPLVIANQDNQDAAANHEIH